MDALKKFISKKKADVKFKTAGPGQRLSSDASSTGSSSAKNAGRSSSGSQPGQKTSPSHNQKQQTHHHHQQQQPARQAQHNVGPSDEKKQAALAALSRIEKEKSKAMKNPTDLLANRQLAYVKEQARKEIEAEKRLKELELETKAHSEQKEREDEKHYTITSPGEHVDPESYAVTGVYFTCPLLGPEILSKQEIEANILQFLLEQPEDEIGMSSCLMIHSCNRGREKVGACVDTLCKYLENIIQNPEEVKFQKIRCSNKVFQEKVANIVGVEQFLQAAGFSKKLMTPEGGTAEEEFYIFSVDAKESVNHLTELRDTLKSTTPIRPELDRNIQVLMPAQVVQRRELPPEFYTLTPEEIRKEQKLRAELAERETTLRTKAQRERDELREQRLYRYAVMRIRFPDGFTLQGTFGAWEKIGDIYEFVQENLGLENVEFSLKKSGGEALSNLEASLAESHLPPASIVNFKLESILNAASHQEITYLKSEILALL